MIAMRHVVPCLQLLRVHTGTSVLHSETYSRTHTHPVESRFWPGFYWMRMHCAMAVLRGCCAQCSSAGQVESRDQRGPTLLRIHTWLHDVFYINRATTPKWGWCSLSEDEKKDLAADLEVFGLLLWGRTSILIKYSINSKFNVAQNKHSINYRLCCKLEQILFSSVTV